MAQIFPIDFEEKLTMAQDDYILFSDSEDGNKIKKAQYSNLKGEKGDTGTAATVSVGTTTTGAAGTSASVTNVGTSSAAVFNFTIPKGADGTNGQAATISVGTTTTLDAGDSATVTNSGTSSAAVFNFGIPKGDTGDTGAPGNGIASVTSSKVGKTTTVTITETNGNTDSFTVEDGVDGQGAGDVLGPASSTDGHLAVFDGITGKLIKDGGAIPTGLPAVGSDGQVLKVVSGVAAWATPPSVVDALNSTSTTDALSANQGKVLNDKIADLFGLGKFLSLWNATTGLPDSFPLETPYTYTTGDYFLVETVSTATPPVNYKPTGSSYSGTASTTTESEEVEVGDIYIYDGTNWLLQLNHGKAVSFSEIAGSPSDNTNLSNALNDKQDDFYTASASQPASPAAGDQWYDTTNQVLKVYNGSSWEDIGGGDAKVFEITDLTSAANLTIATQAYTYAYTNKKGAIIRYGNYNFTYSYGSTTSAQFCSVYGQGPVSSAGWLLTVTLKFTVSSGSVTAITQYTNNIVVSSSVPTSGTNGTITLVI